MYIIYVTPKIKSKNCGKIYVKLKYEIFLQWNTISFLQKVLDLLQFGSCQNNMNSVNLVAAIDKKLWNERALECKGTGEPCICEYVTLLQSFHWDTLSIYWYRAQKFSLPFPCSSYLDALLRLPSLANS